MRSHFLRHLVLAPLVAVALGWSAPPAWAQDFQFVAVGRGAGSITTECVLPGPNLILQSTAGGDDVVNGSLQIIVTGLNGICETVLLGDDVRPANGVTLGTGLPNAPIIVSGGLSDNGICDDTIVALGDDVVRIPPGQGEPRTLEIKAGLNGTIDSTPAGDDRLAGVICAGPNTSFQTTVDPADVQSANDSLCNDLCASAGCIIPGTDGILQSTPAGDDQLVPFISTGPDGVAQTTAASNDDPIITPGKGAPKAACVSAGPDGIAQTSICGNGVVDLEENGLVQGTDCEDGNTDPGDGCSPLCQTEVCGNGIVDPGEPCDDGNTRNDDDCLNLCATAACGDGSVHSRGTGPFEECEPPNTANCDATCRRIRPPGCGNGRLDAGEECDDGNTRTEDNCTNSCTTPVCGDGSVHSTGKKPFEDCDDGNLQSGDGCSATCVRECGNSVIDGACVQGTVGALCTIDAQCDTVPGDGVCAQEECDDGNTRTEDDCTSSCTTPVCGDGSVHTTGTGPFEECDDGNLQSGDGCSAACVPECGNGVIDGACVQGTVGALCTIDAQCDTVPGDGVCAHEECDPGLAGLCTGAPPVCSNVCLIETCGNGVQECAEACDLGPANGVPGSGCSTTCTAVPLPQGPESRAGECLSAFTVENAPDLTKVNQLCDDGAPCDFDQVAGQCTFHVHVCLNRTDVAGCTPGNIRTFDLTKVTLAHPEEVVAARAFVAAVLELAPGTSTAPDRCRKGAKHKVCSVPDNQECDSFFGAGDGICDLGSGVVFAPPLDVSTQAAPCTEPVDVVVPVGGRLRLNVRVKRPTPSAAPSHDNDPLRLKCRDAP